MPGAPELPSVKNIKYMGLNEKRKTSKNNNPINIDIGSVGN